MSKKDASGNVRIPQRDKLKTSLTIRKLYDWTSKQQEIIKCILDKDTKVVFIDGVAGTSKTFLSTYCGLQMLSDKKISEIIYFRTVIESAAKGLGYLPGEFCDKFKPFITPLQEKLDEFLSKGEVDGLIKDERVRAIPVNYLRGCSFNANYLFADEAQNFEYKELVTLLTRIGKFSKLIVCGDSFQSDINGKSGFFKMINLFNDEESRKNGIFCFKLEQEDIVRSEIVKFIVGKLNNTPLT